MAHGIQPTAKYRQSECCLDVVFNYISETTHKVCKAIKHFFEWAIGLIQDTINSICECLGYEKIWDRKEVKKEEAPEKNPVITKPTKRPRIETVETALTPYRNASTDEVVFLRFALQNYKNDLKKYAPKEHFAFLQECEKTPKPMLKVMKAALRAYVFSNNLFYKNETPRFLRELEKQGNTFDKMSELYYLRESFLGLSDKGKMALIQGVADNIPEENVGARRVNKMIHDLAGQLFVNKPFLIAYANVLAHKAPGLSDNKYPGESYGS